MYSPSGTKYVMSPEGFPVPEYEMKYRMQAQKAVNKFRREQAEASRNPNSKPVYKYDNKYTTPSKGRTTIYVDSITTAIKELNEKGGVSPRGVKSEKSTDRVNVMEGDLLCSPRGCARVVIDRYVGGRRKKKRSKRSTRKRQRSKKKSRKRRTRKRSRRRSRKRTRHKSRKSRRRKK